MRELTPEESAAFVKCEKRRQMAAQIRFRVAGNRGAIDFIDDLLAGLPHATPTARTRVEPELVARKAHILRTVRGLVPLVRFFEFSHRQLLDPILKEDA